MAGPGGCTSKDCDLIGYESGVTLQVPGFEWRIIELCIDDTCARGRVQEAESFVAVGDEPDDYGYRFAVVAPDGTTLRDEGRLRTREHRANGAGCPPLTANATIVVSEARTVSVTHP